MEFLFQLSNLIGIGIIFVLPILMVRHLPWPTRWRSRAILAVLVCWVLSLLFLWLVHFPLGIHVAEQSGAENPYQGYDNNNFVPLLFVGWLGPALPLVLWGFARWFMRNFGEPEKNLAKKND